MEVDEKEIRKDTLKMPYLSKFRDWHVKTVFYYALLGMTEEQISIAFDISLSTFNEWKNKFPTFLEAFQKGKEQADAQVVHSVYRSAIGYEVEAEQIVTSKRRTFDPSTGKVIGEETEIIRVPVIKKYPPNMKAALRWLEVRQPAQWSNRKEISKTLTHNHRLDLSGLSLADLQVLQRIGFKQDSAIQDAVFWTDAQQMLSEDNQTIN